MKWAIDIPNCFDIDESWKNVEYFETENEAIEFAKRIFGADNKGRISIVSFIGEEYG